MLGDKSKYQEQLQQNIAAVIRSSSATSVEGIDTLVRDEQLGRITELQDFIKKQRTNLTELDEALVKRWLKQITVWLDHFTAELKSGLNTDIGG